MSFHVSSSELFQDFQEFDAMPKLRHGRQAAFDRQSLGKAQASAGCFPLHLNSQPCWSREKTLLVQASAGQLDNNWLILFRFWMRLLQCDS